MFDQDNDPETCECQNCKLFRKVRKKSIEHTRIRTVGGFFMWFISHFRPRWFTRQAFINGYMTALEDIERAKMKKMFEQISEDIKSGKAQMFQFGPQPKAKDESPLH